MSMSTQAVDKRTATSTTNTTRAWRLSVSGCSRPSLHLYLGDHTEVTRGRASELLPRSTTFLLTGLFVKSGASFVDPADSVA